MTAITNNRRVTFDGIPMFIGAWVRPVNRDVWLCNVVHKASDDLVLHVPATIDTKTYNSVTSKQRSALKRIKIQIAKRELARSYKLYRLTGEV